MLRRPRHPTDRTGCRRGWRWPAHARVLLPKSCFVSLLEGSAGSVCVGHGGLLVVVGGRRIIGVGGYRCLSNSSVGFVEFETALNMTSVGSPQCAATEHWHLRPFALVLQRRPVVSRRHAHRPPERRSEVA